MEVTNPAALRIIEDKIQRKRKNLVKASRKWQKANPEAHKKYAKEYITKNKERLRTYRVAWTEANKEQIKTRRREARFKAQYGLTVEERDAMLAAQGGCCAVCGSSNPGNTWGWAIDHCHSTNVVRGILCSYCNTGLGFAKDNVEILKKMVAYLERYANDGNLVRTPSDM